MGDPVAALGEFRQVQALRERLAQDKPDNLIDKRELAEIHYLIAEVSRPLGDYPTALAEYRSALTVREEIAALAADDVQARLDVSEVLIGIAELHHDQGELVEALASARAARAIREMLAENELTSRIRRPLSWALSLEAEVQQELGHLDEALELLERCRILRLINLDADRTHVILQRDVAWAYSSVAEALRLAGRLAQAQDEQREALIRFRALHSREPDNQTAHHNAAWALRNFGRIELDLREFSEAAGTLEAAVAELESTTRPVNTSVLWKARLVEALVDLASLVTPSATSPARARRWSGPAFTTTG